ncbi:MAG: T9SS type A sorting domain-containing protein [Bacteroidota bacterium]
MRRILFTLLFVLGWVVAASAQSYYYIPNTNAGMNPGGVNTDEEQPSGGLSANWATILNSSAAPIWSIPQFLPIPFEFAGQSVTQYKVSSTGVLTFDLTATLAPPAANAALPSPAIPDASICVWGLDMGGTNDAIATATLGDAPFRQHWIMWTSCSHPGVQDGWTYWSIVLEETTNKIYLVDQRTICIQGTNTCSGNVTLTAGIQVNSTEAIEVLGSPQVNSLAQNSILSDDNTYYEFVPGSQPANDAEVRQVIMSDFLSFSTPVSVVEAEIRNLGTDPITSVDLNYSVNGSAPITATVTGLNIPTFASANITHPINWNIPNPGNFDIKVWTSRVNGNADASVMNDTAETRVVVATRLADRELLHEVFTSATCGPCRPGNDNLHAILDDPINEDKYTAIKYQQDFPGTGDIYATTETINRRGYYSINSIPRMELDGQWDGNAGGYTQALFDQFQSIPSLMEIHAQMEVFGSSVGVEVIINPFVDIASTDLTVQVVVIETRTVNNVATNGETEFLDVAHKMIPDENGTTIQPLSSGVPVYLTGAAGLNYTFPAGSNVEDFMNLRAVVFVQDNNTKEVFQSAKARLDCPNNANYSVNIATNNSLCVNTQDGSALASPTGGISPFTYVWNDGSTGASRINLPSGRYTVTTYDSAGCATVATGTVTSTVPPTVLNTTITNVDCSNDSDGRIDLAVSGGNPPYTYSWSNGGTSKDQLNLPIGNYTVTVTDNSGCKNSATASIIAPTAMTLTGSSTPDNGTQNGSATVTVSGGSAPYSYTWTTSPVQFGPTATNLAGGVYEVTVFDSLGCKKNFDITVDFNVSLEELDNAGFLSLELFPNPTQGDLNLSLVLQQADDVNIRLFDLQGKAVLRETHEKALRLERKLNLAELPAGMYMLKLDSSQGSLTRKVLIE